MALKGVGDRCGFEIDCLTPQRNSLGNLQHLVLKSTVCLALSRINYLSIQKYQLDSSEKIFTWKSGKVCFSSCGTFSSSQWLVATLDDQGAGRSAALHGRMGDERNTKTNAQIQIHNWKNTNTQQTLFSILDGPIAECYIGRCNKAVWGTYLSWNFLCFFYIFFYF